MGHHQRRRLGRAMDRTRPRAGRRRRTAGPGHICGGTTGSFPGARRRLRRGFDQPGYGTGPARCDDHRLRPVAFACQNCRGSARSDVGQGRAGRRRGSCRWASTIRPDCFAPRRDVLRRSGTRLSDLPSCREPRRKAGLFLFRGLACQPLGIAAGVGRGRSPGRSPGARARRLCHGRSKLCAIDPGIGRLD